MASPSRSGVHVPSGAGGIASQAAYLSSLQIINVPGPSPSGSLSTPVPGPRGYVGDTGPGFYTGKGAPPSDFGSIGDYWIDNSDPENRVLYGPKVSATSWPKAGQSLRGEPGADGLRGTQIYRGIGAPPEDVTSLSPAAQPGDLWIDIDPNNASAPIVYFLNA